MFCDSSAHVAAIYNNGSIHGTRVYSLFHFGSGNSSMAKVSKKKVSKKSLKKSSTVTGKITDVRPNVMYDDEDDEEDLSKADENITSEEEEEDGGEDERKRQKLLEAISVLGGKRQKKLGERSEAAVQMSEFTVNAEGQGDKIDLSDLIGTMDKTSAVPAKTKKQLKNLQRTKKTIECPISKQESERIQRDVAFQKAATEVTRWKGIIKQNQRAEQLVFPLNQEPPGPKPMERVVTGWKAQTPLEQEIFALLSANKQPINDPILTPAEEASMRAMSLEEAKIRRAELQKARALQSYYEAKARRDRKIKSKKYHKVQNKAKRKEFLKEFDEMVKTDPAAALEQLNKIELARMQERMSLKHQNSGKWAKSKVIMAKYDEGARKAMQQQLEVNKELTQKLVTLQNNDDGEEEKEAVYEEVLPDFVNDAVQGLDFSNPWMRGKLSEDLTEKEISDTVDLVKEEPGAMGNTAGEEDEEEVEETEEEALLREFDRRRKLCHGQETDTAPVISVDDEENESAAEDPEASDKEEEELSEFTSLFRGIADSCPEAEAEKAEADASHTDTSAQLEEGLVRIRTLEDMELLSQEESVAVEAPVQPPDTENLLSATQKEGKNRKRKRGIELNEVLTKETKVIQVPLAPIIQDTEDSDEKLDQRGLIKEAFAGDDVVSDFLKDKRKQEDAGKPKVVDLTLPGWGEWGGTNLQPSRNKRRRFKIKTAPPPPRRDQHLPSVIMSEKRNSSISVHQVNSLPFPFQNQAQFESTIRSPLGRTWNSEQTVKKISKPKVVTQLGAIIEPMSREELMKDKKQVSTGNKSTVDSWKRKH
ncbi:U3 small nucleolar RNA-associated protein 14 homolog A [Cottoperca gobio]|uniref:U3 small nucleolar RNA-associated protein 14 homolog A n=1 Tax=Cottoperca gobio TaxID=56716 RepID=A0A6J2RUJ0_COTGO|nr:U3 small nucleolar RNA-associated protein 14 homolog A-like [Cottoperca gobio]